MNGVIEYVLWPPQQEPLNFRVAFDQLSVSHIYPDPEQAPRWTRLENNRCDHCPLSSQDHRLCPLAARVVPFVEQLSHLSSIEEMKVDVTQFERTRHMVAPVQDILGSLLGLFVATSECPHTYFLRPMAYFHLPLADADETVYRVMSMYRLAQYFRKEKTGRAYAGFEKLAEFYENMVEVNRKLSLRMRDALSAHDNKSDGTMNAITLLDALSQYVPASIDDSLQSLEPIFHSYWDEILP